MNTSWSKEMMQSGVIINGLLPNSTAVLAIMDELFRAFKGALRTSTHEHYAGKIKNHAREITKRKVEIARKMARREEVSESERAKTRSVVGLNPMDLGPILFGKLTDDGHADPKSPIATGFTKEKILEAFAKVRQTFALCSLPTFLRQVSDANFSWGLIHGAIAS